MIRMLVHLSEWQKIYRYMEELFRIIFKINMTSGFYGQSHFTFKFLPFSQDIMEVRRININGNDCTLSLSEIEKAVSNISYVRIIYAITIKSKRFDIIYCQVFISSYTVINVKQVDSRTVMVAIGAASNACGTINPIKEIAKYVSQRLNHLAQIILWDTLIMCY